jgi:hypothetical protein
MPARRGALVSALVLTSEFHSPGAGQSEVDRSAGVSDSGHFRCWAQAAIMPRDSGWAGAVAGAGGVVGATGAGEHADPRSWSAVATRLARAN